MNCEIVKIARNFSRRGRSARSALMLFLLLLSISAAWTFRPARVARAAVAIQNSYPVTSVSAASYVGTPGALAPNSIVAAFGTQLATGTQIATTQPLPTKILTTSVTVGNIPAPLFFVSANQINYLIPENAPAGDSEVVISSTLSNGDQVVSRGQIRIAGTGPALFTADASGGGAPAALTGRVNENSQFVFDPAPPYRTDPANPGRLIPAPVDVGTTDRPAFLILYGTGIRNATGDSIRAVIGGVDTPVEYFGAAPGYAGLDQVNLRLPASMKGRGLVDLTIVVNGASSNSVSLDLAGTTGQALAISGFSVSSPALAGQTVIIQGSGFSTKPSDNLVRFGPAQARVVAASANQLTVIVPFGAQSGQVTVQANQVEARSTDVFKVKTSISGIVQSTGGISITPAPLNNVTVRLAGTNISVRTTAQGTFVLSDIPPGIQLVEIDGGTNTSVPPYPAVTLKLAAKADRDNQFSQPINLQAISGGSASIGSAIGNYSGNALTGMLNDLLAETRSLPGSSFTELLTGRLSDKILGKLSGNQSGPLVKSVILNSHGIILEVPFGTSARFPDGKTGGQIQMTLLEGSRLPGISLPTGIYSSMIAQITPIGTKFTPGASISFPNPDPAALGPGTKVSLYRYDSNSGGFIRRGSGTVSPDRTLIVSDGRIVDVASFWLVATPARVTTVAGRVVDGAGLPVSGVRVSVNGRASLSDLNGGFTIPDVSINGETSVQVEAVVTQQFGTPPRGLSTLTPIASSGITNVGTVILSGMNQAGLVMSPFAIDLGPTSPPIPVNITVTQPAPAGGLTISLSSDDQSVASVPTNVTIPAGQTTTAFNVSRVGPGTALVEAKASLGGNTIETSAVISVALPGPKLKSLSETSATVGARITISGTGLSVVPNNQVVAFLRNNELLELLNPYENEIVVDSSGAAALRVKVPNIPPGQVSIVVSVIDAATGVISERSNQLTLGVVASTLQAPQLTSVPVTQGKPREQIVINGSGFSAVREENQIQFIQDGLPITAQVVQSSATSITVSVPALGISRGKALITARRLESSGASSGDSNGLNFTIISDPTTPTTPLLSLVTNVTTGVSSGKDGDTIRANGKDFGTSTFSSQTGAFLTSAIDPIATLMIFTQNNQFVNFSSPTRALNGVSVEAVVPSGLKQGTAQVTVLNFDSETGLISDESLPVNFTITSGSDFRLDESEPNDSPDLATRVFFPMRVEGRISHGDPGSLAITFNSSSSEVISDLFRFTLDQSTQGTITLNFNAGGDLDLFLLRKNDKGKYDLIASSTNTDGILEALSGTFTQGEYLIGVAAYSGSSSYLLNLQYGITTIMPTRLPNTKEAVREASGVIDTVDSTPNQER